MRQRSTRSGPGRRRIVAWRTPFLCGLMVVGLSGCAGGPPPAVPPVPGQTLGGDEGFVVIQVDSELAIERLEANGRPIAFGLQPGQHLWLVRMRAGRQCWTAVRFEIQASNERSIRPEAKGVLNEKEFEFTVEAGAINYPGEIIVRMNAPEYGARSGFSVRNRNHSAIAIRKLMKTHADLLEAHPIRYAGSSGDEFLQFYTKERDRLRGDARVKRASAGESR